MSERAAVILAAGQGTRMKSPVPKVLHKVGARALIDHAIDVAEGLGVARIVVVLSADAPQVRAHVEALAGFSGEVVVTLADSALLIPEAVRPLFDLRAAGADVAVLGFHAANPIGYGRLIVTHGDRVVRIVEEREASPEERQVSACNSGVLAAPAQLLFDLLGQVGRDNAKGEYYLTDVVGLAAKAGKSVRAAFAKEEVFQGVNSQAELAEAEAAFQRRRRLELMTEGVTLTAPETVFLAWDTQIAAGVLVEPHVVFGPGVAVATGAVIRSFSHLEGTAVRAGAVIGPFARLRPGADIGEGAHIGNFVEVKKVAVGKGAKANHLAYLGDGSVGAGANIGAGTIFCNYDGFDKYDTHVGEGAFIGSDTALVAPVRVGAGAYTGSGSVITQDVAPDALALARGRQVEKPGWAAAFRERKLRERAGEP
jgi:bifunctional UDP-N-acetylglucosamine pyrophosphorylase/glucosamine-1-phosphate N-acetyltransferase